MDIKFSDTTYGTRSLEFITDVMNDSHNITTSKYSQKITELARDRYGFKNLFLTPSCSSSLLLLAIMLRNQSKQTILVPSFTFTTSVASFVSVGFNIKYVDIDSETLCLDLSDLESQFDDSVFAVVNTNYAGYIRNHIALRKWCTDRKLLMIEDAAHSFTSKNQVSVGSISDFTVLSFHASKNISCGEGGGVIVNNENYVERIQYLRDKGTNRHNFLTGKINKYGWVDKGSNFKLSEILAASLYGSILELDKIMLPRIKVWNQYYAQLKNIFEEANWLVNPGTLEQEILGYHIFFVVAPSEKDCKNFIAEMNKRKIPVQSHYTNLHNSSYGSKYRTRSLINSEKVENSIARLPLHSNLSELQVREVVLNIREYFS